MDQKIELKPCPFCGGKVDMCKDNYGKYMAMCSCGAMIGIELEDGCELVDGWRATFESIDKAVDAWNKRTDAALLTADVQALKHGTWGKSGTPCEEIKCSICGGAAWYYNYGRDVAKSRFCPNCGAKMDGKDDKEIYNAKDSKI